MIDADELPEGWAIAKFEELCDLNPKHSRSLTASTEVSFVPMAAVSDTEGRIIGTETRPYSEVKKGYTHFADGDVIFAKITPCMENGKAASVRGLKNGVACGTTEFFVFRSRGAINQDYLFHFIRQESYRKAARATMQSGVGQARVPKEFIQSTEIPLPPLSEQIRIVARLEELQARSRAAREALADVPKLLEQYRQSVLAAAFRGDLTAAWREKNPNAEPASVLLDRIRTERRKKWEAKYPKKKYVEPEPVNDSDLPELPDGWCWASAEELTTEITVGHVGPMKDEYVAAGVPFLRSQNVRQNGFDPTELRFISPAFHGKLSKSRLTPGDVAIVRSGEPGVACVIPNTLPDANCSDLVIARPISGLVPQLLVDYLHSPNGSAAVVGAQVGVAQQHFNIGSMRVLAVPTPPELEQLELVRKVAQYIEFARHVATEVSQVTNDLDHLDQSLLAKAFRGELVPQDSTDEPASVLLERLRTSETVASTNGTPRRKAKR